MRYLLEGSRARRSAGALACVAVLLAAAADAHASAPGPYFTALSGAGQALTTPRAGAIAAPLPDGQVLIAGGYSGASTYLTSAELFNPLTQQFTALTGTNQSLAVARAFATATNLPDGDVLIAGGYDGNTAQSSAELFDPSTDTFTLLTGAGQSLVTARYAAVAAPLPDGDVLIAGGFNATVPPPHSTNGVLASAELFDPTTETFSQLGGLTPAADQQLTTPREHAEAAPLPGGKVLIAGGQDNPSGTVTTLTSVELFDPATETFTALTGAGQSLTSSGAGAVGPGALAASLPDGQVLIAGGQVSGYLSTAELFDPTSEQFTALQSTQLTTPRQYAVTAPLTDGPNAGSILIAGGLNGSGSLNSAELYESAPELGSAGGDFGSQTVAAPSDSQPITLTDDGAQPLHIYGLSLQGTNAADFTITYDGCTMTVLAYGATCPIDVRFTPGALGGRTAQIDISDNEPNEPATLTTVTLTGIGVPAVQGPPGANGTNGAPGANGTNGPPGANGTNGTNGAPGAQGPAGPAGAAGRVELVDCVTTTKTVRVHRKVTHVKQEKCSTKLVSSPVKISASTARAALSRRGVLYATGAVSDVKGVAQLRLRGRRALSSGRYRLTLSYRVRHRQRTVQTTVEVT